MNLLQVTTLSEYRPTHRRGGRSRKVTKLVQIVEKAAANFIAVGEEIASENPDFQVGLGCMGCVERCLSHKGQGCVLAKQTVQWTCPLHCQLSLHNTYDMHT